MSRKRRTNRVEVFFDGLIWPGLMTVLLGAFVSETAVFVGLLIIVLWFAVLAGRFLFNF